MFRSEKNLISSVGEKIERLKLEANEEAIEALGELENQIHTGKCYDCMQESGREWYF